MFSTHCPFLGKLRDRMFRIGRLSHTHCILTATNFFLHFQSSFMMPKNWFSYKYIFVYRSAICLTYTSSPWHGSALSAPVPMKSASYSEDTTLFVLLMVAGNSGMQLFFEDALTFTENICFSIIYGCGLWFCFLVFMYLIMP